MSESVLEKHNAPQFSFHSYYTPESPTYYELYPFLKSFNFPKEKDVEDSIPSHYVKYVSDFKDEKFNVAKILDDTPFITKFGIWHLVSLFHGDKHLIRRLSDSCFSKVEAERTRRIHSFVADLMNKLELSVNKQNELQDKVENMKNESVEKYIEYNTTVNLINETLMLLSDKHNSMTKNINELVKTLKK